MNFEREEGRGDKWAAFPLKQAAVVYCEQARGFVLSCLRLFSLRQHLLVGCSTLGVLLDLRLLSSLLRNQPSPKCVYFHDTECESQLQIRSEGGRQSGLSR